MSDIVALPVLSRQSFTLANVTFLDRQGQPYTPSTVEKRVTLADGVTVITEWEDVGGSAGFSNGDSIPITADETETINTTALTEKHVIVIAGDRDTDTENPLRIVVQIRNRYLLP